MVFIGLYGVNRFMPKYMYPYEVYPDYLRGAGYLMSIDVVNALYEKALKTSYVYLEDVFVTGKAYCRTTYLSEMFHQ